MKNTDLAYIAGIIDGEGCIRFTSNRNKDRTRRYYSLVEITMTKEFICQWLHFAFGGYIYCKKIPDNKNWAPQWRWYVKRQDAYDFLKAIYPFLRIKKAQAELAIKLEESRIYHQRLRPMDFALQGAQEILMKQMNKRGAQHEHQSPFNEG